MAKYDRNPKTGVFLPGSGGRTRGARNRLANRVFQDALAHWDEIEEVSGKRKGLVALELAFRERPNEYCRLMSGLLPKEFTNAAVELDLDDNELDLLIEDLRRRVGEQHLEQRADVPLLPVKAKEPVSS